MIGELCRAGGRAAASRSTKSPSPATPPCSSCSAASTPAPWAKCLSFRPPRGACWRRRPQLGLRVHPRGRAWILPVIGGFVGGDTVAGVLATGLADARQPTLFVDIGTNGEIVLCWPRGGFRPRRRPPAPPSRAPGSSHGMRGTAGAIEKVVVDGAACGSTSSATSRRPDCAARR